MSSPIPPDPYAALGVAKDADLSAIRSAHRKLVLKFHPDRIQDESLKEEGKNKFQKIQQAYELLSDPVLRERYDNKIKLAELRRDAMMRGDMPTRDVPIRAASSYSSRPTAPSTASYRDSRDDTRYWTEERTPAFERRPTAPYRESRDRDTSSYFDSKESFEEVLPRERPRKTSESDRKPSYSKSAEKEKSSTKSKTFSAEDAFFTVHAAAKLKRAYQSAKENKEKEKIKEREMHERKAEARDRAKRDDRSDKYSTRRPYVEDNSDDSDTITNVSRATVRPSKSSPRSRPENVKRPSTSGGDRPRPRYPDEEDSYEDKYERIHAKSREYINESKSRPNAARTDSAQDTHYWHSDYQNSHSRRSGSDSDRRPSSSSRNKRSSEKKNSPRPSMPTQSSAPSNLKAFSEVREPSRSTSGPIPPRDRDYRKDIREPPSFARSKTMPTSRGNNKDNVPTKSSGLKHGETQHYHDSGYGSSSTSPVTPDLREESPIREPKYQSKKYFVVDAQSDDEEIRPHRVRPMTSDDERRRERRPRMTEEHRTKTARPPQSYPARPPPRRAESDIYTETRSPKDSPSVSRENSTNRLYREISPEPPKKSSYSRKVPLESINTAPRRDHASANYTPYVTREPDEYHRDYSPNSKFQSDLRYARRPSVN